MTPEEKAEKWVENHLHQEENIPSIFFLREAYLAGYAEAKLEEADLVGKLMAKDTQIQDLSYHSRMFCYLSSYCTVSVTMGRIMIRKLLCLFGKHEPTPSDSEILDMIEKTCDSQRVAAHDYGYIGHLIKVTFKNASRVCKHCNKKLN